MGRTNSATILLLILLGVHILAFETGEIRAIDSIIIRVDGSIDPPTAPIITTDNITYSFASNIYDKILIERDNIIVDGNGFYLIGNGMDDGFDLSYRENVTICNMTITIFGCGVYLQGSCDNIISKTNITFCTVGVSLRTYAHNNTIHENFIYNCNNGIWLYSYSEDNLISQNTIDGGQRGIKLTTYSHHNTIYLNSISQSTIAIELDDSGYCQIVGSNIKGSYSADYGIYLHGPFTDYIKLYENRINTFYTGIRVWDGGTHTVKENDVRNCHEGIWVGGSSSAHKIFHNNFYSCAYPAYIHLYCDWDNGYPSGGNYWSDYTGVDQFSGVYQNESGSDGIGDTFYSLSGGQDNYPLMHPYGSIQNVDTDLTFLCIQSAIDSNETLDDHTILVSPDLYTENIVVDKAILLHGTDNNTTIIDGNGDFAITVNSDNTSITGFTIINGECGIWLNHSNYVRIADNDVLYCNSNGICCYHSNNSSINRNNLSNNSLAGIWLEDSNDNIIRKNTISNNTWGAQLLGDCSNNTLETNVIEENQYGINLYSNSNKITGNFIQGSLIGFNITAWYNTIILNQLVDCEIHLTDSDNNRFFHNDFYNVSVSFNGVIYHNNSWDSGVEGNFWNDYSGPDFNFDGIGDDPYEINENNKDQYPLVNSYIGHNIAVTNLTLSKSVLGSSYLLQLDVDISNLGSFPETFDLTIYFNSSIIVTNTTISMSHLSSSTVTFFWNSTDYSKGNYLVNTSASILSEEMNSSDNSLVDGWLFVTIPGDVDGDKDVDIFDIVSMAGGYGVVKGHPQYESNWDINGDDSIDIFDIVIACGHYGEEWG